MGGTCLGRQTLASTAARTRSHSSTRAKTVAVPKVTPTPADGISAASNKQRLARRPTTLRSDYLISAEEATAAIGTNAARPNVRSYGRYWGDCVAKVAERAL